MPNEIAAAKAGLTQALTAVNGLRILDHAPDAPSQLPAAIVRLERREAVETLARGAIIGTLRVEILVPAADPRQATAALQAFLEPRGPQSVEAAAAADPTWGGAVDDARLTAVDNIGDRPSRPLPCLGADFHFRFIKSAPD